MTSLAQDNDDQDNGDLVEGKTLYSDSATQTKTHGTRPRCRQWAPHLVQALQGLSLLIALWEEVFRAPLSLL